ncbi:MAG TPA: ERF family protein [Pyrinomonadaceae bacterium]|nr:ERF family protein [Pyrinomonadaceae bacterium]
MNKSEQIGQLAKALSLAQKDVKGAAKDGKNPHFRSEYATLAAIWDACRDALTANNLAVTQTMDFDDGHSIIVETTLMHSSGEWISGRLAMMPAKADPQGIGSAITYARRYALAAIVGVAPEDDDAEAATRPQSGQQKTQKAGSQEQPKHTRPQSVEQLREEILEDIKKTCALLNSAGDLYEGKKWTAITLTKFIADEFETDGGLDALSPDYLKQLLGKLNLRLDRLNSAKMA